MKKIYILILFAFSYFPSWAAFEKNTEYANIKISDDDCPLSVMPTFLDSCNIVVLQAFEFPEGAIVNWTQDGILVNTGSITTFLLHPGENNLCAWYEFEGCTVTICETYQGCEIESCPQIINVDQIDCYSFLYQIDGVETGNVVWDFGDGFTEISGSAADHSYLNDGFYIVTAEYSGPNCTNGTTIEIAVEVNCGSDDCPLSVAPNFIDSCNIVVLQAFEFPEGAIVNWTQDGILVNTGSITTFLLHPGENNLCAWYEFEGCTIAICETYFGCEIESCPSEIWSGAGEECGVMNFEIGSFVEGENVTWFPGDESGVVEGGHFFTHTYSEPGVYYVCAFYTSPICPDGVELCTEIVVENCEGCPTEIWSGSGEECGVMNFEIGSFVEGENVTWLPGDESGAVEGGHFFTHTYSEPGVYYVCAFYTSPICPDGVELCTEIVVENCEGCPTEIWSGSGEECGVMNFEIGSFVEGENVTWFPGDESGAVEGGHFFTHTYSEPGVYNVCAFYTSPLCPNGVELCTEIVVDSCNTDCSMNLLTIIITTDYIEAGNDDFNISLSIEDFELFNAELLSCAECPTELILTGCVEDGCYQLSFNSDFGIDAESILIEAFINNLELPIGELELNLGEENGTLMLELNSSCFSNLNESSYDNSWLVYPNPANQLVNIQTNNSFNDAEVFIFDSLGKIVLQKQVFSKTEQIDISNITDGIYTLFVKYDGENKMKRIEVIR